MYEGGGGTKRKETTPISIPIAEKKRCLDIGKKTAITEYGDTLPSYEAAPRTLERGRDAVTRNIEEITRICHTLRARSEPPVLNPSRQRLDLSNVAGEFVKSSIHRPSSGNIVASIKCDTITQLPERSEPRIKQEAHDTDIKSLEPGPSTSESTRGKAQALARRILYLHEKRKNNRLNIEVLRKRINQSQLTYAELVRKRNRLERNMEDLKEKLKADERILEAEQKSADQIPDELEQVSAELATLVS